MADQLDKTPNELPCECISVSILNSSICTTTFVEYKHVLSGQTYIYNPLFLFLYAVADSSDIRSPLLTNLIGAMKGYERLLSLSRDVDKPKWKPLHVAAGWNSRNRIVVK
jgi:hypothetical protein